MYYCTRLILSSKCSISSLILSQLDIFLSTINNSESSSLVFRAACFYWKLPPPSGSLHATLMFFTSWTRRWSFWLLSTSYWAESSIYEVLCESSCTDSLACSCSLYCALLRFLRLILISSVKPPIADADWFPFERILEQSSYAYLSFSWSSSSYPSRVGAPAFDAGGCCPSSCLL